MTEREAIHSNPNIATLVKILMAKWGPEAPSHARYMADHAYNKVTVTILLGAVQAELNLQY